METKLPENSSNHAYKASITLIKACKWDKVINHSQIAGKDGIGK